MNSPSAPRHPQLVPPSTRAVERSGPGRTLLRTATALLVALAVMLSTSLNASAAPPLSETMKAEVADILTKLRTKESATDPRYLENNIWRDGTPECFRCTLGPGVLSAQYGVTSGLFNQEAITVAVATFDTAIKNHQRPDGAIFPAGPGEGGLDIQTVLFANELAQTYLLVGSRLDFAHRKSWSASLTKSADWLIRNGNLSYYTNGNINLALSINMDLTYRITKLARFKDAAARSIAFTLSPPQNRWPGYGLKYTMVPTQNDGSNGRGYLAESGGGAPGYDTAYTMVQANLAAFWFYLTGNETAKRLTNLFYNQLEPRVRTSDWTIDVSGGTRRTAPGVRYRFASPALAVLALKGGRPDLQPLVRPQAAVVIADYKNATKYPHASISFGYGSELAPIYAAVTSTLLW